MSRSPTYRAGTAVFRLLGEAGTPGLTADEIRDHVRAQLARYKVPRDVTFVEALPRNAAGKVLKRELR